MAYTATFGSGFSATVSLEDRISGTGGRENGIVSPQALSSNLGQDYPDIIASLRVDQGWGSAQLSGAIAQRNINAIATLPGGVSGSKDELAFAVQGGVKFNLPMLAAGDTLFLQAAYADGALGYLGWGGQFGSGRITSSALGLTVADFSVDGFGRTNSATGWSIVAAFRHFWTPQLRSELFGSYSELKLGYTLANQATGLAGVVARPLDPKEAIVGANLIWSPVSGLDIGVEVLYTRTELKQAVLAANNLGARPALGAGGRLIKSDDAIAGRLRIQRDF